MTPREREAVEELACSLMEVAQALLRAVHALGRLETDRPALRLVPTPKPRKRRKPRKRSTR